MNYTGKVFIKEKKPSSFVNTGIRKISFIFPALNEETVIGYALAKIPIKELSDRGLEIEVIVVDNASEDNTAGIARSHGAIVVSEPNRGYGNAYRTGFRYATGDVVVMADADGTYPIEMAYELIKPILENNADVVLGSRLRGKIYPGAMSPIHKFGNRILTLMLNVLFFNLTSDAHSGFRAFRTSSLRKLQLTTSGMEFASELVIEVARKNLRVAEIPIPLFVRSGSSVPKIRTLRDGGRHVLYMLKTKMHDIVQFSIRKLIKNVIVRKNILFFMLMVISGLIFCLNYSNLYSSSLFLEDFPLAISYVLIIYTLHRIIQNPLVIDQKREIIRKNFFYFSSTVIEFEIIGLFLYLSLKNLFTFQQVALNMNLVESSFIISSLLISAFFVVKNIHFIAHDTNIRRGVKISIWLLLSVIVVFINQAVIISSIQDTFQMIGKSINWTIAQIFVFYSFRRFN